MYKKKKGGSLSVDEIQQLLEASYQKTPSEINGYLYDKELSNDTAKVYYNPSKNHATVVHRGTKGLFDHGNNLAYSLGLYDYTNRYKKGQQAQEAAHSKYGSSNVSTLGHSQGSILGRKLGKDSKEIIQVNPAYLGEAQLKNEYVVRSQNDPVSVLYDPFAMAKKSDQYIKIKPKSNNLLKEHSYQILNRLNPTKQIGKL